MEMPSEIDISSFEGLTRLFRFAVGLRENDTGHASLAHLESRFGLAPYVPAFRGALEDFARQLDGLEHSQRFKTVCDLIFDALPDAEKLDDELASALLEICSDAGVVRFSFSSAILPCLLHAQKTQQFQQKAGADCEVRYAGVGLDKELMAFASLFLDLGIYTESNPPWDPDTVFDNGEPNFETPDLEIAFPPADFRSDSASHLDASVRASQLPRAVDRGKYDLESVMLAYLCEAEGAALVFTSMNFLSSPKQSRLLARQHLLDLSRVSQVTELTVNERCHCAIDLSKAGYPNENIRMVVTNILEHIIRPPLSRGPFRPKLAMISVDDIRSAGDVLKPSRYLGSGPTGGRDFTEKMNNISRSTTHILADYFEIIRPKTTKRDPVGTFPIQEVRAGNISANGEMMGSLRKISVRSTLAVGLEEQVIKTGDILFAHRGPVGKVAYVNDPNIQDSKVWAGQTLMIFRARRKSSAARATLYCDPKVLFMYMLTPDVQASWSRVATGDRSPAVPIGIIESFGLPDNLILPRKPKRKSSSDKLASPSSYTDIILLEFQNRQNELERLREIQIEMNDGLDRVSNAAWSKMIGQSDPPND
ncbi:restriction endonuclease subunit S [Roseovarius sp. Pro17]|uniref:restriction endonuclease subunit S n=1 Tax=Roseovarius sp. Pro17 TaxID=3108175 RepID=UPI002D77346C|nr:restriction endonuclease subunit S [Roseovarius sp. Pro17]